ncbi:hypothetical protein [Pseudomonas sp. EA_35y_Pfl2_R5]|uniref:hypothetical protein n=1 Tax=Pseudomonas sp. EA_35y_Pfl2_R5 TaxID=3088690 RepID=UPI0030DA718F
MANLLPVDVAQEAHFSNKDTWDSCQDGKQIKDVSKQSAKAPQSRGFLFYAQRLHALYPLGLARKNVPDVFVGCHPWPPPFGPSLRDVENHSR